MTYKYIHTRTRCALLLIIICMLLAIELEPRLQGQMATTVELLQLVARPPIYSIVFLICLTQTAGSTSGKS